MRGHESLCSYLAKILAVYWPLRKLARYTIAQADNVSLVAGRWLAMLDIVPCRSLSAEL
jgi:hypothetical protein